MTQLCVPIFVRDVAQARRDVALAAEAGADLVELRVDDVIDPISPDGLILPGSEPFTTEIEQVQRLLRESPVPCILTCRPTYEGGRCEAADAQRLWFLWKAGWWHAAYIDTELQAYRREPDHKADVARDARCGVILSAHDFKGRPDRLYNIITEMNAADADVNKIVWMARTVRDNLEAFELLKTRQRPTIALCMGEAGLISRVLAKKFGGFLSFASLNSEAGTAPGQVSIADMKRLYRWDAIGPETKVYGVVAQPVMHSMSPAIHNGGFEAVGYDGVYLPMLVNQGYESFKAFMESFVYFEGLDLGGLSVTIPHKENALRYLKEKGAQVEELAERIGAVNTIIIERISSSPDTPGEVQGEGRGVSLRGLNTDYAAILDTITSKLHITREKLGEYRVAVIGAGGTGRTAVAALAEYGATVVVYNRTLERAEALAREFDGRSGKVVAARLEKLCDSCCHIFINTTSVGMHPNVDESPLGERPPKFSGETLVFDTIYNPMKTRLLRQAEEAGARTVGGVEMFVRQAAAQFEAWTAKPAPLDVMRRVIEARLGA